MRAITILITSLYCCGVLASPTPPDCFTIEKTSESTGRITSYQCDDQSLEIPSHIDGLAVTVIGASAFEGQKLVSVLIPDGVEAIEEKAFHQSYLEKVSLPDSIEIIEGFAFWYCELTEVSLPKNLRELGYGAFSTNKIKNVVMPNTVTQIGPAIFYNNDLETVVLSNRLTEIPQMAFHGNKLKNVVVPNQVKSIGEVAFSGNKLFNIKLPKGLEVIGRGAFQKNLLKEVSLPLNLRLVSGNAFSENQLLKVKFPAKIEVIERGAFIQNSLLNIKVPGKTFLKDAFDESVQVERFGPDNSGLWAKYHVERKQNSLTSEFEVLHDVTLSGDQRDYILLETRRNKNTGEVTETSSITDPRLVDLDFARERRDSCEGNGGEMKLQFVSGKEVKTCKREQPGLMRVYAEVPFGFFLDHSIFDDDFFSLSDKKQLLDFGRH